MKKILIYIAVMAFTLYFGIMYEWQEAAPLLAAELVFPFLCFGMAAISGRKIKAYIKSTKDTIERGERLPVRFVVRNKGRLPAAVKAELTYSFLTGGNARRLRIKLYVSEQAEGAEELELPAESCGKMLIGIRTLRIYDCFGFACVKRSWKQELNIIVMPKPYPVNLIVSSRTKWFPIDGESYADDRPGDDNAEVYEVREYRAGDRMQKVHWKLSAKEDGLYIKEFSYPLGAAVVLLLEGKENHRAKGNGMESFLEVVVSFSAALYRMECPHYVVWKERNRPMERRLIRNEEAFHGCLKELLNMSGEKLESNMEAQYRQEYRSDTYATLVTIKTDLRLRVNQEAEMDMGAVGLESFFETTEIVV